MILLSNSGGRGVNPFFPLIVTEKYRKITVVEWTQYRRLLPLFVIINTACATAFAMIYLHAGLEGYDSAGSLLNFFVFAYVILRLKYGRRMIDLDTKNGVEIAVAPVIVWFDYMSIGAMFVFLASVGSSQAESDLTRITYTGLKIFFTGYSFLPILNYLKYLAYGAA